MSEALQAAPADLATLHRKAQARIQVHPAGIGYHGQYQPLMELAHRAEQLGGQWRVVALAACQDVADADDAALARMLRDQRPSPTALTAFEAAQAKLERHRLGVERSSASARPRVSLAEQLSAMEARGIRITVEGRHLKVHAAPGVVTEGDRTLLREHKPEIVVWLNDSAEMF